MLFIFSVVAFLLVTSIGGILIGLDLIGKYHKIKGSIICWFSVGGVFIALHFAYTFKEIL